MEIEGRGDDGHVEALQQPTTTPLGAPSPLPKHRHLFPLPGISKAPSHERPSSRTIREEVQRGRTPSTGHRQRSSGPFLPATPRAELMGPQQETGCPLPGLCVHGPEVHYQPQKSSWRNFPCFTTPKAPFKTRWPLTSAGRLTGSTSPLFHNSAAILCHSSLWA